MADEPIELNLDRDDFTIGDMEDFEEASGENFAEFWESAIKAQKGEGDMRIGMKTLKALVWITQRKEKPNFSLTDARDVKITALRLNSERPTRAVRRATAKTTSKSKSNAKRPGSRTKS